MGSIPARCWAFISLSILSNVSSNMSLEEVQHYCYCYKNESLAVLLGVKPAKLSKVWDLKKSNQKKSGNVAREHFHASE